MKRRTFERGFLLFEAMIAVTVFAIGVIALGSCVQNCLVAQRVKESDARARQFLVNRMAEIEEGSIVVQDKATEELKGIFAGMIVKTRSVPVDKKNEKKEKLFGILQITLDLEWKTDNQVQSRELTFYVYPRQR